MNSLFNGLTINLLEKALDTSAMRQKVISNNIANVNTPGFKRSEVRFEEELARALDSKQIGLSGTDQKHIGTANALARVAPKAVQDNLTTMRTDGNNVDIDAEMNLLAQNQIMYSALVQRISGKFKSLEHVISDGRK